MNECCAHLSVEYYTKPGKMPGTVTGRWECRTCGQIFKPCYSESRHNTLKDVLNDLYDNTSQLEKILLTVGSKVSDVTSKPIQEMGISEKVKLAKLFLSIKQMDI